MHPRDSALGSPLREICTAGSARGDEPKKLCRLGEGTAAKAADQQRGSAKATGFEARPYPPHPGPQTSARASFVERVRDDMDAGRLIGKWLNAGVMEARCSLHPEAGTPLSPPAREGPTFSGITGTQGPTRWRGDGTPPCRLHTAGLLACAATPGSTCSSPVRQMVDLSPIGGTSTSGGTKVGTTRHRGQLIRVQECTILNVRGLGLVPGDPGESGTHGDRR